VKFTAAEVATATGGRLIGSDIDCVGATFDSRLVVPGALFVPVPASEGGRDGHEFLDDAHARGAHAHLLARGHRQGPGTAIEVDDVQTALGHLARWARDRLDAALGGRVVGITGSVGKTSTKDLTRAAVGARWETWASPASYNNDWGLPVTLLNSPDDVQALVVEMGMRGFGEIARLCDLARPQVAVVTSVAEAHTGRVGGLDGVAHAKGELVESLDSGGTAVLCGDDERVAAMRTRTSARVLTYGLSAALGGRGGHDVEILALQLDAEARPEMTVGTPWGSVTGRLAVTGAHMGLNAAAALTVAGVLDVDPAAAMAALGDVVVAPGRSRLRTTASGVRVLDDTYNANPYSMRAALDTLVALPASRRVAILGLMAELADPSEAHRGVARYAATRDITVIAVDTDWYGLDPWSSQNVMEHPALSDLGAEDAVLVKGSRVARLERVVERLLEI
jgi:UDP-N-acetylmuramoyl-tripeptide--D-alanyl-D-alanine ligase